MTGSAQSRPAAPLYATLSRDGAIGVLTIDNPPVNAMNAEIIADFETAFDAFESDPSLGALIIECAGRTFVAGGDIRYFDDPDFSTARYNRLIGRIEASERPVIAALFGTVLGGGLELAMACHARVAHPATMVGLPEILIGLIPGSLGTQRLPRLAGLRKAYAMMASGAPIAASDALACGVVDRLAEIPGAAARALAADAIATGAPPRRTRDLLPPDRAEAAQIVAEARSSAREEHFLPALAALAACVEAAATLPFADGESVEAEQFLGLPASPQSRALRHMFFAEREYARVPGVARVQHPAAVRLVADDDAGGAIGSLLGRSGVDMDVIRHDAAVLDESALIISPFDPASQRFDRADNIVGVNVLAHLPATHCVEIVRGEHTRPEAIAAAIQLFRKAGRIGLVSGVLDGTAAARSERAVERTCAMLLRAGVSLARIDEVAGSPAHFGMTTAPSALLRTIPPRHDGETTLRDEEVAKRFLYPLLNEAVKIVEDGLVYRPGDLDVLYTAAFGFPRWRGGPLFMADELGLRLLLERLDHYSRQDSAESAWRPARLLRKFAQEGRRLSDWSPVK